MAVTLIFLHIWIFLVYRYGILITLFRPCGAKQLNCFGSSSHTPSHLDLLFMSLLATSVSGVVDFGRESASTQRWFYCRGWESWGIVGIGEKVHLFCFVVLEMLSTIASALISCCQGDLPSLHELCWLVLFTCCCHLFSVPRRPVKSAVCWWTMLVAKSLMLFYSIFYLAFGYYFSCYF